MADEVTHEVETVDLVDDPIIDETAITEPATKKRKRVSKKTVEDEENDNEIYEIARSCGIHVEDGESLASIAKKFEDAKIDLSNTGYVKEDYIVSDSDEIEASVELSSDDDSSDDEEGIQFVGDDQDVAIVNKSRNASEKLKRELELLKPSKDFLAVVSDSDGEECAVAPTRRGGNLRLRRQVRKPITKKELAAVDIKRIDMARRAKRVKQAQEASIYDQDSSTTGIYYYHKLNESRVKRPKLAEHENAELQHSEVAQFDFVAMDSIEEEEENRAVQEELDYDDTVAETFDVAPASPASSSYASSSEDDQE